MIAILDMTNLERIAFDGIEAGVTLAHKTATDAGWYVDPVTGLPKQRNFGEVLMLMVSELAEALEADRKSLMDDKLPDRPGQEVEFGDLFLRVGDTCLARGANIPPAFIEVARLFQKYSQEDVRFAMCLFKVLAAAGDRGYDLAGGIIDKNRYNGHREDHKLENRAAGGKAY